MSFQVTLKEVTVESVKKGKTGYQKAVVAYDYKGEAKTQSLVSFSNPDVFAKIQEFNPGDVIEVTTTKNDAGYNQWAKVELAGEKQTSAPATPRSGSNNGSWETPQERAENRARIVRQSSITNAIATLKLAPHPEEGDYPKEVLDLAQFYFDWVYENVDSDA